MFLPKVEMSGGNECRACQLGFVYKMKRVCLSELKGDLVNARGEPHLVSSSSSGLIC